MSTKGITGVMIVAAILCGFSAANAASSKQGGADMDPNSAIKRILKAPSGHHDLATAFLAWFKNDDTALLKKLAEDNELKTVKVDNVLRVTTGTGATFYMAMLKDVASSKELTEVINKAHGEELLPLLIVQYSNDLTDTRGDNVFDLYCTSAELAITHKNRVFTRPTDD